MPQLDFRDSSPSFRRNSQHSLSRGAVVVIGKKPTFPVTLRPHFRCPSSPSPAAGMLRGIVASPGPAAALLGRCFPGLPLLTAPCRGRKSRTDPPAKSKLGRIKEPPPVDPVELLVVQERYRRYLSIVRALRAEFKHELEQQRFAERYGELRRQQKEAALEEHRQLMAFNDAENRRLQQRRVERLRREEAEEKERRLRGDQNRTLNLEEFLKEREREVLQLQEEAKEFVTPDNLDEKIEACLNNPRSYNFAIDKDGRVAKQSVQS